MAINISEHMEKQNGYSERMANALENLVLAQGGDNASSVEYGVRWITGASASALERVTRKDGVIAAWDISYTANVGENITDNPFDYIDLFAPELYTDAAGNKFRRFRRFYKGAQRIGVYSYIWICRKRLYSFYELPRAFYHKGAPYWNYVDIGVYEGAEETLGGAVCLVSKPGRNPSHNRNRTTTFTYAKATGAALAIDAEKEYYCIETISQYTEILQPLLLIMFGTRNSQSVYPGVSNITSHVWDTAPDSTLAAYDTTTNTIYFSSDHDLRVGQTVTVNHSTGEGNYHRVTESGTVTGSVSGGVFTPSQSGATYYYVKLDGNEIPAVTDLEPRPLFTGETDGIKATGGTLVNDGKHSFKILGIENIYGNIYKHVLDVTLKNNIPYVCKDLTAWSDTSTPETSAAFASCDYTCVTENGYAKTFHYDASHPDVMLTTEIGASTSTYWCDYCYASATTAAKTVFFGGYLSHGGNVGLFCWSLHYGVGYSDWHIGARLSHRAL